MFNRNPSHKSRCILNMARRIVERSTTAKRPNFNEPGLVTFLLDPHAKMTNMNLTRIEANDIAAYIETLR